MNLIQNLWKILIKVYIFNIKFGFQKFLYIFCIFFFLNNIRANYPSTDQTLDPIKFILITSLYNETNEKRMHEYMTCLENNLNHNCINKIHILYDTSKDDDTNRLLQYLQSKLVTITYITKRPTFGYCFNLINSLYAKSKIIISNADIYFNNTLCKLDNYDLTNKFLALTRWDVQKDGSIILKHRTIGNQSVPASHAQDSWIFQAPIRKFNQDNFELGTNGCDNYIAFQADASSLITLNPSLTIQACHLHISEIRHDQNPSIAVQSNHKPHKPKPNSDQPKLPKPQKNMKFLECIALS